jgi:hypothetical protein
MMSAITMTAPTAQATFHGKKRDLVFRLSGFFRQLRLDIDQGYRAARIGDEFRQATGYVERLGIADLAVDGACRLLVEDCRFGVAADQDDSRIVPMRVIAADSNT